MISLLFSFGVYFVVCLALIIIALWNWDAIETLAMNIGEKVEEVRDVITRPLSTKSEALMTARSLITWSLIVAAALAGFLTIFF